MRTFCSLALAVVVGACGVEADPDEPVSNDGDEGDDETYGGWDGKADGQGGLGGPITFGAACAAGPHTTIAAVGDVLLHGPLQKQAVAHAAGERFISLWAPIRDLLAAADVSYANFEGPTAAGVVASGRNATDPGFRFDGAVYASYPQFNYHGYLVDDLRATGFDVVSTANNHSMDRRELGADRTIEQMRAAGMPFTGTRHRDEPDAPWHTYTTQGGFKLAWVACTYGTNGLPDPEQQVLGCWEDETELKTLIGTLRAEPGVDAVIVTPHWGDEYQATPNTRQRTLARRLVEAGATLVLGSHSHVTQPWEKVVTDSGREGFVIYSLGNFVSNQSQLARRSTLLLYVGLTRTATGVEVSGVRYVPLVMMNRDGHRAIESIDRVGGNVESRKLTVRMYGEANLQDPDLPIDTRGCP